MSNFQPKKHSNSHIRQAIELTTGLRYYFKQSISTDILALCHRLVFENIVYPRLSTIVVFTGYNVCTRPRSPGISFSHSTICMYWHNGGCREIELSVMNHCC